MKLKLLTLVGLIFAVGCTTSTSPKMERKARFTPMGTLPSGSWSAANKVARDGTVVGIAESERGHEAVRWRNGKMESLGDAIGENFSSFSPGISANGQVTLIQGKRGSGNEVSIWTQEGEKSGLMGLGDLKGGSFNSEGHAISADGSVVVGQSESAAKAEAFIWTKEQGMKALGFLPGGVNSVAYEVSADGRVVAGNSETNEGTVAFVWTEAQGMQKLPNLPGGRVSLAVACAVSAGAVIMAGGSTSAQSGSVYEAVMWKDGNAVALGDLPGGQYYSIVYDISGDGSIAVGESSTGITRPQVKADAWQDFQDVEAFIWDANNGMRNLKSVLEKDHGLDLSGWILISGEGISEDGKTIVGWGINPDGKDEGWIVSLP